MYMMAKHIHLTAVALSVFLFVLRFLWSQYNSAVLQKTWAKVLPHVIDTVLLASAIWLCVLLSQYPLLQGWLTFKLVGLIVYIFLGLVALKLGRNTAVKWAAFVGALVCLAAIAHVAVTKQPLFL
ncbi:SirB2 family protein [Aestuariibacter sp. A3R04]|uniref:SirB2 family protein n=1 Tax=Aestuariibacter sp. A3R04 TaxID=2841571 RepID=UPI001C084D62|nr:SirB2 family protein [Aestuariibacter sp. A3R04]MBU3022582.1 SirB2 family protein [Aestuariibacter sp. A3R04]